MANLQSAPPAVLKPTGWLGLESTQLNLVNDVWTQILINLKYGGWTDNIEDLANRKITPGVAGTYLIFGSVGFTNVVISKQYGVEIKRDTTVIAVSYAHASVADLLFVPVSLIFQITATQSLTLWARSRAGVDTVDVLGGESNTYLAVQRLR